MQWEAELEKLNQSALLELAERVSVRSTQEFHFAAARASGPFVWDSAGKRYFDFTSGVGVANLGYNCAPVKEAVVRQLERGILNFADNDWPNPWATLLKEHLTALTPGNFPKKVFLSNSGAEAVEAAIKVLLAARPERQAFITFEGAFHGRTGYALALNVSKPVHRKHFPHAFKAYRLPFPEARETFDPEQWLEAVKRRFATEIPVEEVNAVFLELVQGEGGINVAHRSALRDFLSFLQKHGIAVVVDEIQTGLYRTGRLWAVEHYGIEPDIMCLGKALGCGLPIGATVIREELDFKEKGRHSNTFGGNALASVAALTCLELIRSLDEAKLEKTSGMLAGFAPEGIGFMRRRCFSNPSLRDQYVTKARERSVILLGSGVQNVRFMPPVTVGEGELSEAITALQSI